MTRASPQPRETTDRRPRARGRMPLHKRPLVVALGSSIFGFCCGALFWHAVGFWSFVSDVVLKGPDDGHSVAVKEARSTEPPPVSARATSSISPARVAIGGVPASAIKARSNCSVAISDPAFGEVHVFPCAPGTGQPAPKPLARKGDRLDLAGPPEAVASERVAAPRQLAPPPVSPVAAGQAAGAAAWTPTIRGSAP
jgi:hypothetical protein